jgi:hypothetical protein
MTDAIIARCWQIDATADADPPVHVTMPSPDGLTPRA